jgi:DNA polymerase-1
MAKTLYILDGHYQIYRAFYGLPQRLSSPTGEPTGAIHVFCQMLFNLIRNKRPDYLIMAMDVSDETVFRRELDENYKAHRDPAPEELHIQADRIVSIVEGLGIPILRVPGFEADDVMATIAERLRDKPVDIYLVSRDKDLEQLISKRVSLYDAKADAVLDAEELVETKGYPPDKVIEVQTLVGDSTDNVPGVQGVGVKTAAKLIKQYGSAQAVLENADMLTPKMSERVKAFADQLPITRRLVTLRRDVPLDFNLDEATVDRLNVAAVRPLFEELGFTRLTEQLEGFREGSAPPVADERPTPTVESARRQYDLIDTPRKFSAFVTKLARQTAFAFDTETTGLNPVRAELVGLSFAWQAGQAFYIPVQAAVGPVVPLDTVVEGLRPILEDPDVAKVGHHIKYDVLVLRQVGIRVAGIAFDTMLASFLLDPLRGSHSLDNTVKALIGHEMIPISDLIGRGKKQITIDQVEVETVCEYAAEDADFTWQLKEHLEPQIKGSHVESLFTDTEMPLVEVLAEMEHNGIALDCALLKELSDSMGDRTIELKRDIQKAAGHEFNVDSTRQLAAVLFDEQRLPVV